MLPYVLLVAAVTLYSQEITLGMTNEAQIATFVAMVAYLFNSIVLYR
jgi:hypothetical protein